jgi:hypothetical protein
MKIRIDRRRISHTDDPVEVFVDGRRHSLSFATDIMIMDCLHNIDRYIYYSWDYRGIFRNSEGPFVWFFNFKNEEQNYSQQRFIKVRFPNSINYEVDKSCDIEHEINVRLGMIIEAIKNYKETTRQVRDIGDDCIIINTIDPKDLNR